VRLRRWVTLRLRRWETEVKTVGNCEVTTERHYASRNSIQFFSTRKDIVVAIVVVVLEVIIIIIQRKWNMKASVIPVITMTTGVISKSLRPSIPEQHTGKTRNYGTVKNSHIGHSPHSKTLKTKLNSVALVRTRTIPTEQPPPVGEVSANFCG